jgi:hypothetical protein
MFIKFVKYLELTRADRPMRTTAISLSAMSRRIDRMLTFSIPAAWATVSKAAGAVDGRSGFCRKPSISAAYGSAGRPSPVSHVSDVSDFPTAIRAASRAPARRTV